MDENATGPARFEETLRDFWATRPVRPSSGSKLAGVSAGIGARYGIDPVLIRIGFALLAFYGGSGVVLYLLGWLLLPKENRTTTSSGVEVSPSESTPAPVAVVLVVLLLPLMLFWVNSFAGLVGLLAGFAAMYLLHRYYADRGNAAARRGQRPAAAEAGGPAEPAVEVGDAAEEQPPEGTQRAPEWDPLGAAEFAWDLPEPQPQEPQPADRRARPWITAATALLAVAAAVAGLLAAAVAFDWAGELQWVLAIAAVAVGIVLLVSSVRSRRAR